MKLIGIIGGTGPESTIDYYKKLVEGYREKTDNKENPHILINSINLVKVMSCFRGNKLDELATYLLNELNRLINAGADFVAISANTPHLVYNKIKPHVSVPFISIVEETAKEVKRYGNCS